MTSKDKLRKDITAAIRTRMNYVVRDACKSYYCLNIPETIYRYTISFFGIREEKDDEIAVVQTSRGEVCSEGIVFTVTGFYCKDTGGIERFDYDKIKSIRVISRGYADHFDDLEINTGYKRIIGSTLYKKSLLKLLLEEICSIVKNAKTLRIESGCYRLKGSDIPGAVYGNVSAAATTYSYDKFSTPQGHGFAAEKANHMYDKLRGHDAHILGDDNAPNSADRSVDGILIQSKYCASGQRCINECFNKQGQFRYYAPTAHQCR